MAKSIAIISNQIKPSQADIEYLALNREKIDVMTVNDAYHSAKWCDFIYYDDKNWFNAHRDKLRYHNGVVATIHKTHADWHFFLRHISGLSITDNALNMGNGANDQAINLALLMRYETIYLFGFKVNDKYSHITENLYKFDCTVYNCNTGCSNDLFPRIEIKEILK